MSFFERFRKAPTPKPEEAPLGEDQAHEVANMMSVMLEKHQAAGGELEPGIHDAALRKLEKLQDEVDKETSGQVKTSNFLSTLNRDKGYKSAHDELETRKKEAEEYAKKQGEKE